MDTITRAKKHREKRDAEIAKKLADFFKSIERKEIEDRIFEKVMRKYNPKLEKISNILTTKVLSETEDKIREKLEIMVAEAVAKVTFEVTQKRIIEEVESQLREKFSALVDDWDD